jgi:threonine aldolase
VASGLSLKEYGQYFDSVSLCFSKGLGAPVGSVIAGSGEFINRAHRYRKVYGGGMRQAGILAAAALYAMDHHIGRLAEDHDHAKHLAESVSVLPGVEVDLRSVQTNIIFIDVSGTRYSGPEAQQILEERGVLVLALSPTRIRAVTHLEINDADIDKAVTIFQEVFS